VPSHADPSRDRLSAANISRAGRCAILLHTLADGSSHFDWLIESLLDGEPAPSLSPDTDLDARSLICFRSAVRPDLLQPSQTIVVERLPDHRRLYLDHQGPVSGDRGTVRRIARGSITDVADDPDSPAIRLRMHWNDDSARFAPSPLWLRLSPAQDAPFWNLQRIVSRADST
jgi:hypothetical protein